jgi:hypothetical protein
MVQLREEMRGRRSEVISKVVKRQRADWTKLSETRLLAKPWGRGSK